VRLETGDLFTIFPAIDLRGGRVVRLTQGRAESEIVYSDNPAEIARRWEREGAAWLHIVNLDGAFGARDALNTRALENILAAIKIPAQFGGGLRDIEALRRAFDLGVSRVIIGTLALEQPTLAQKAVDEFGAARVALAIDARDGLVKTRGWTHGSAADARVFGKQMRALGLTHAIVTDIARDGMLEGIDANAMADFARATALRVIASGGVASLGDLTNLRRGEPLGITGVIIGQALYKNAFTLADALRLAAPETGRRRKPRYCEG